MRGSISMTNKIIMPCELTAENGAKSLLMGEFFVETDDICPNCEGDGCDECDNIGFVPCFIQIPWSTIKKIYATAVDGLGESVDNEQQH